MVGNVFNIQRFSTDDGPGIRTTVFLKGCPLNCIWCHNPESKASHPEIFYDFKKCIKCRKCKEICKQKQHIFDSDKHIYLRDNCIRCAECVSACPADAFELCGKEMSSDFVAAEAIRDKEFYAQSEGGVTLSGGEPLAQYEFSLEILKKLKNNNIHTAVETCGYCYKNLDEINEYVDLWLYDIKLISEEEHTKYTGVSNAIILKNLFYLDSIGANIILRCPIIPDVNFKENHFDEIVGLAAKLKNIISIHFEPYHPLGIDKAIKIGKNQEYENKAFLDSESIVCFVNRVKEKINTDVEIL